MSVLLGVLLAVGAVVLVALPFLREPVAEDDTLHRPDEARLLLVEERDRALAALKELEFDHRAGKVADDDYRALVGPLRRDAARALKAIEREPRYGSDMTGFETPDLPAEPTPPPDEGTIPSPAEVPEPYPPPDEATIPSAPQE
jgi:hypothetical protein